MSTSDVTVHRSPELAALAPAEQACACCAPAAAPPGPAADAATTPPEGPNSSRYEVEGMTCGHCVSAVTQELTRLPGVRGVDVDLVAGGVSTVVVTSDRPLADEDARAAIHEAGYTLRS